MRFTKIVATLGPACAESGVLASLIEAGMDAARLNFSHGTRDDHRALAEAVRAAETKAGRPVALIQDLQGTKIRVGPLRDGRTQLATGATVRIHARGGTGDASALGVDDARLVTGVRAGSRLLLGDGDIELEVAETRKDEFVARVVHGGILSQGAGITAPDVPLPGGLTAKDQQDMLFGREIGVDYVATSFVATRADVADAKEFLAAKGETTPVIAKIERREALANLDGILDIADAVLVARGDLGIALPPEEVPVAQKRILAACNARGTPSITATQMLESMIKNPRPTRAEANDVANAIFDGSHAVMLSGETAVGAHPVAAVAMMARIARRAEAAVGSGELPSRAGPASPARTVADAIAAAAARSAAHLGAKAILAFTQSGSTARMVAKYRPTVPVLAPSPSEPARRRLALVRGLTPFPVGEARSLDELIFLAETAAKERGLARAGDLIVIVAGEIGVTGTTNLIRISTVK